MDRILKTALFGLSFNIAFGAYNIVSGTIGRSWWLITVGIYYAILSILRFFVLLTRKRARFVAKVVGAMLMILSIPLAGTVILATVRDRGRTMHEIIMIAMAAYAFAKITLAIINLIKTRKSKITKHITLRNISFADACVSIFALQRSMLASFGNMSDITISIFNALLGSAVCIIVLLLGLNLVWTQKIWFTNFRD